MIKGQKVSILRLTDDNYGGTVGELGFNGETFKYY